MMELPKNVLIVVLIITFKPKTDRYWKQRSNINYLQIWHKKQKELQYIITTKNNGWKNKKDDFNNDAKIANDHAKMKLQWIKSFCECAYLDEINMSRLTINYILTSDYICIYLIFCPFWPDLLHLFAQLL